MRTRQGIAQFFYHLFMFKRRCGHDAVSLCWHGQQLLLEPRHPPSPSFDVAVQRGRACNTYEIAISD